MTELIADRYRVEGEIASGGMGRVLLAEDTLLSRKVAVKRLHEHMNADPEMRERFKREAMAAASITHPNVVTVFDAGEDEAGAWLVMELVEGETLAQRLASSGPLPVAPAALVGAAVARGLHDAHQHGMVHRDVKPANVLLLTDGRTKIGDFGIAKALDGSGAQTTAGKVFGTAAYVSPEQAGGEPATPASDIYALGVVLYEAVCGEKPFTGNPVAVALAHRTKEPPPLPADVDPRLAEVISRAMAKDPADRFESAQDMAAALEVVAMDADAYAGAPTALVAPAPVGGDTAELADTAVVAVPGRWRRRPIVLGAVVALVALALLALLLIPALSRGGRGDVVDPFPTDVRPSPGIQSPTSSPTGSGTSPSPSPSPSASPSSSPSPTSSPSPSPSRSPTSSPSPSPTTPSPSASASPAASGSPGS